MIEIKATSRNGDAYTVAYLCDAGANIVDFAFQEAADLFAAAPRVLAERDRLREALKHLTENFGKCAYGTRQLSLVRAAEAALKETEVRHEP